MIDAITIDSLILVVDVATIDSLIKDWLMGTGMGQNIKENKKPWTHEAFQGVTKLIMLAQSESVERAGVAARATWPRIDTGAGLQRPRCGVWRRCR